VQATDQWQQRLGDGQNPATDMYDIMQVSLQAEAKINTSPKKPIVSCKTKFLPVSIAQTDGLTRFQFKLCLSARTASETQTKRQSEV